MNILICYNVAIIFFLQKQTTERDPMIRKDLNDSVISLKFNPHSFKSIYIYSFTAGVVITFLFVFIFLINSTKEDLWGNILMLLFSNFYDNTHDVNDDIIPIVIQGIIVIIFGFSFIVCLSYYIKSKCNRHNISNKIYLKSFAVYALICSLYWLYFNVVYFFILMKLVKDDDFIYLNSILACLFVFALITKLVYRWRCYYVQTVLITNSSFCNKLSRIFLILFCCYPPQGGTIVDYNSMFIVHSLATNGDFTELEGDIDSDIYSVFGDGYQSNKESSFIRTNK